MWVLSGTEIWYLILFVAALILGCFVLVILLHDVLTYRDLRRRLREERRRKEAGG
ncbi:MAG: hypothetical protein ACETVY_02810 [Candidatus Bathyarchaeia archaeon]